ncbi:hypothetical protein ACWD4B_07815 [Streptomyces sp. NPDC002536]
MERVVQPVVDPGEGQSLGSGLAVRVGAFFRSELEQGLGSVEVVVELAGLSGEEQVLDGLADQGGALDLFRDAVAQVVVEVGGTEATEISVCYIGILDALIMK